MDFDVTEEFGYALFRLQKGNTTCHKQPGRQQLPYPAGYRPG
jgi:hypothetical protein